MTDHALQQTLEEFYGGSWQALVIQGLPQADVPTWPVIHSVYKMVQSERRVLPLCKFSPYNGKVGDIITREDGCVFEVVMNELTKIDGHSVYSYTFIGKEIPHEEDHRQTNQADDQTSEANDQAHTSR